MIHDAEHDGIDGEIKFFLLASTYFCHTRTIKYLSLKFTVVFALKLLS